MTETAKAWCTRARGRWDMKMAAGILMAWLVGMTVVGEENMSKMVPGERAQSEEIFDLNGLRIAMSRPRVVAETSQGHCWYPDLLRFSSGELMLNHSLNPDSNENPHNSQAVYISTDRGRTFDFTYDVNGFHNGGGEPRIALPDGRIMGTSSFLRPHSQGDTRRFVTHRWIYDQGGRRYTVEPWGATVSGLPQDVAVWHSPSRTWWSRINWFSDILQLEDGRLISTLSLCFDGDTRESTVALVSKDEGRNWKYLSTIAGTDAVPDAKEGFDEPCLVRLETDELMCVSRVGSGQKLARTYSGDDGKTWSKIDRLPAASVAPQVCRTANGTLVLSTGRPGVFLWFSTDPRGSKWQSVDVISHHNRVLDPAFRMTASQTTAYTAMVEVAPDEMLLVYDRAPLGWSPVTADSGDRSQICLLRFRVIRGSAEKPR